MQLIPFGYLYKRIPPPPETLGVPLHVTEICSAGDCVNDDFCDFITHWRHNGFGLFDNPKIMQDLAGEKSVDISGCRLFYFEGTPDAYDEEGRLWSPLEPIYGPVNVTLPATPTLLGYDIVSWEYGNLAHSPLSCNGLAAEIDTNSHCLIDRFEAARAALESGAFAMAEPGPYRIMAVYEIDQK